MKFNYEILKETEKAAFVKIPYWEMTSFLVKKNKQLWYECWIPKSVLTKDDSYIKWFVLDQRDKKRLMNACQKAFFKTPGTWASLGEFAPPKVEQSKIVFDNEKIDEIRQKLVADYGAKSFRQLVIDAVHNYELRDLTDEEIDYIAAFEFPKLDDPRIPTKVEIYYINQ